MRSLQPANIVPRGAAITVVSFPDDVLPTCSLCKSNTVRNIETIGLLGGSLSSDGSSFNITTLIIPKQKGETDRVEMLKEEEIWEIFFQVRDLHIGNCVANLACMFVMCQPPKRAIMPDTCVRAGDVSGHRCPSACIFNEHGC